MRQTTQTTSPPSHPGRRRFAACTLALASLALAACSAPALASERLVSMEVLDRDAGQLLPVFSQAQRRYVPGRPGARYAVRLRNLTGGRVLAVLSVDGVNVISGQTAAWGQTGYVLDPYESYDITGWRKSDAEVAAFQFAALEQSYAAQTGRPGNVGVIGVAAFRERYVPPPVVLESRRESEARDSAAPAIPPMPAPAPVSPAAAGQAAPAAKAAPSTRADTLAAAQESAGAAMRRESAKLGTAHGERESSYIGRTPFERASPTPQAVLQLEYDSMERLVAAGIVPTRWARAVPGRPSPFPSSESGFVPDPPAR